MFVGFVARVRVRVTDAYTVCRAYMDFSIQGSRCWFQVFKMCYQSFRIQIWHWGCFGCQILCEHQQVEGPGSKIASVHRYVGTIRPPYILQNAIILIMRHHADPRGTFLILETPKSSRASRKSSHAKNAVAGGLSGMGCLIGTAQHLADISLELYKDYMWVIQGQRDYV